MWSWLLWELFRLRGLSLGALVVAFLPSASDLPLKKAEVALWWSPRAFTKLVAVALRSCFGLVLALCWSGTFEDESRNSGLRHSVFCTDPNVWRPKLKRGFAAPASLHL